MLTANEKIVLKHLLVHFTSDFSINQIAKSCSLSPNGALKILKKLEAEEVLQHKQVGNVKSYSINFSLERTRLILQLMFMDKISEELEEKFVNLKSEAEVCILLNSGKEALVVSDEKTLPKVKGFTLKQVTTEELLTRKEELQTGLVLWGHDKLIEVFARVS